VIGIFGGTFDPVHNGHIQTVNHVQQQLQLAQVRLIPLGHAVHRNQPQATPSLRLELLQAALENYPNLVVDDREIRRGGGSYTFDTLESLKQDFPDKILCLITGTDAFNGFTDWFKPDGILKLAHIVVMQRPDTLLSDNDKLQQILAHHLTDDPHDLKKTPAGKIFFLPVPQLTISSTQIRQKLAESQTIDELLPEAVASKIHQWGLYSTN